MRHVPRTRGSTTTHGPDHVGSRVARLEGAVENIAEDVGNLTRALETNATNTNLAIDRLAREFAQSRLPQWPTWIAAIGLILLLFSAGLTPLWIVNSYTREDVVRNSLIVDGIRHDLNVAAIDRARFDERLKVVERVRP